MLAVLRKMIKGCLVIFCLFLPLFSCYVYGLGYLGEYFDFVTGSNYLTENNLFVMGCLYILFLFFLVWKNYLPQIKNAKYIWFGAFFIGAGIAGLALGISTLLSVRGPAKNYIGLRDTLQAIEICMGFALMGICFFTLFIKCRGYSAVILTCFSTGLSGSIYNAIQTFEVVDFQGDLDFIREIAKSIIASSFYILCMYLLFGLLFCAAWYFLQKNKRVSTFLATTKRNTQ